MTDESSAEHPHTVVLLRGENSHANYILDDVDSLGFQLTRIVGDESWEETLRWHDVAEMILLGEMRIYGMTDEEVEDL